MRTAWIGILSKVDKTKSHMSSSMLNESHAFFVHDLAPYRRTSSHSFCGSSHLWTWTNVSGWGLPWKLMSSGQVAINKSWVAKPASPILRGRKSFFNVTSTLRINTTADKIFYCTFQEISHEENNTAELVIPGNILNISIKMCLVLSLGM